MQILGINHLTIATKDLSHSLQFYEDILGLERVAVWDNGVYLLAGELWVCLSYDPDVKEQPLEEYSHIAFAVSNADFDLFKQAVVDHNIPIWKENKSEGDSLYLLDPDHNKLELHASDLKSRIKSMLLNPYSGQKLNDAVIKRIFTE